MLSAISSAIDSIVSFFTFIWDLIVKFVEDIIYVVQSLSSLVTRIPSYLSFLPSTFISVIMVGIGVAVVYKVIGRD